MKIEIIEVTAERILKEWVLENPEIKSCGCELCIFDAGKAEWGHDDHEPV